MLSTHRRRSAAQVERLPARRADARRERRRCTHVDTLLSNFSRPLQNDAYIGTGFSPKSGGQTGRAATRCGDIRDQLAYPDDNVSKNGDIKQRSASNVDLTNSYIADPF